MGGGLTLGLVLMTRQRQRARDERIKNVDDDARVRQGMMVVMGLELVAWRRAQGRANKSNRSGREGGGCGRSRGEAAEGVAQAVTLRLRGQKRVDRASERPGRGREGVCVNGRSIWAGCGVALTSERTDERSSGLASNEEQDNGAETSGDQPSGDLDLELGRGRAGWQAAGMTLRGTRAGE
jgi:hypothetical protein